MNHRTHNESPVDRRRFAFVVRAVLLVGLLFGWIGVGHAQEEDLEAQRQATQQRLEQLQEQIQRDSVRLAEKREAEQANQTRLKSLRREIALREELVSEYQTRLQQLERERSALRDTLSTLEARLADLRDEYRRRLTHAYKYGRLHDVALLLASRSINQMLIRARYLQRFAADRQAQRSEMQRAAAEVRTSRKQLAQNRAETRDLLGSARTERENLRALERDRRQLLDELQAEQSEIQEQLNRQRKQAKELQTRIQRLLARARREENEDNAGAGGATSAAFENLSSAFREQRGRLPWPVDGVVTSDFGTKISEFNTETYQPGIEIETNPRSTVRAVFRGTVVGVDFVAGYGTYVVIRHGDFLSVYSNFSSLAISEDQRIQAGQVIGQSGTESEPLGASLFFGVVNQASRDFVDPTRWLASR